MKRTRVITNALFGLWLFLPLIQRVVPVFPRIVLTGVEKAPKKPEATWSAWFNGSYAEQYEKRYAARLSLRPHLVRTDNELSYRVFGQIPARHGTRVVLGRSGWLYEGAYIDQHNRPKPFSGEKMNRRVAEARSLQDRLLEHGIGCLIVLVPSKVTIYPEFLPAGALTRPIGEPGAYERVVPALEAAKVRFLDVRKLFLQWKEDSEFPLFPRTGTHWSYAAATRVAGEIFRELGEQTGKAFPEVVLTGLERGGDPYREENDLGDLLNLWSWRRFAGPQIQPIISVRQPNGRPLPRLLFVGDSFAHTLNRLLDRHHAVARQDLLYYYQRRFSYPGERQEPIDPNTFPLRQELLACDAVILVINEHWLPDIGFGFLAPAAHALEAP